jgi:hypothetical protein
MAYILSKTIIKSFRSATKKEKDKINGYKCLEEVCLAEARIRQETEKFLKKQNCNKTKYISGKL